MYLETRPIDSFATQCTFVGNNAMAGGVMYSLAGDIPITTSTFVNGAASYGPRFATGCAFALFCTITDHSPFKMLDDFDCRNHLKLHSLE